MARSDADDLDFARPAPDITGRTLGDFLILRKIGQGGMGQVYLARQLSLKREVALKILRDDHAKNETALKRFQAEAEAVARISHPNIVQVYAVGEHEGQRYMALEYVEGRNLRDYLDRKGPPNLPVALYILKQIASALQRANELGLVHRDIKPENVLLNRKVEVKVADFGLSRYFAGEAQAVSLTQTGMTLGTPLYMSPEQVQGKPVDHRSDLYSFGVTAYHLLAGYPPFKGATAFDVALQHVKSEAEPLETIRPDLPADLGPLVGKLMAKKPEDRFQSAKDVIRELTRLQKGLNPDFQTGGATTSAMPPIPQLNLSGSQTNEYFPIPARPKSPWLRRGQFLLAMFVALGLGWWISGLFAPKNQPAQTTPPTTLIEFRSTQPIASRGELALREKLRGAAAGSREAIRFQFDLGLLQVDERRFDDADKAFKELEKSSGRPDTWPIPRPTMVKLGLAISQSAQDHWKESIKLFEDALAGVTRSKGFAPFEKLCFDHPEIGRAIADAVTRNTENKPKDATISPAVDSLRSPSSLLRGPGK